MTPTRLILARHGQAHCNVRGIIGGPRGCTGLTDYGYEQVRRLADRLCADHAEAPIAVVYTTPLRRVRETADVVGDRLGLPVVTLDELREPDYGDADGTAWADVGPRSDVSPPSARTGPSRPAPNPGAPTCNGSPQPCATSSPGIPAPPC
jgi:probable phosphoglycerate mutase